MADAAERLICACPQCGTRFRITAETLEVAGGMVRCGACLARFDGRAALIGPAAPPPAPEPEPAPASPDAPDAADVPDAADAPDAPDAPDAADSPATEDAPSAADAPSAEDVPDAADVPDAEDVPDAADAPSVAEEAAAAKKPASPKQSAAPARTGLLLCGCILLALSLGSLAAVMQAPVWSQTPHLHGIYETACAVLRCTLPPLADLAAIDVSAEPDAKRPGRPEKLTIRATLTNRAPFRQPFPTLAVSYRDARGAALGTQRIAPRDYLPRGASRRMAPNRATTVTLALHDPGPDAATFSLSLRTAP